MYSCIQPENYTQKREFLQAHVSVLHMNRTFPGSVIIINHRLHPRFWFVWEEMAEPTRTDNYLRHL